MRDFLRVLFTPSCWIQLNKYSKALDVELSRLIVEESFTEFSTYRAKIGGITFWIGNHPYGSFNPYGQIEMNIRPSRATILRAHEKLVSDMLRSRRIQ